MYDERSRENVIEWISADKKVLVTFSQHNYIRKIKKLAEQHPDEVDFIENTDGTICGHIPLKYIRIAAPRVMNLTEEEKQILRERFLKARKRKEELATMRREEAAEEDEEEDLMFLEEEQEPEEN